MNDNSSITVRHFLGFVAMILGALVGWGVVELFWQQTYDQGTHMWVRPVRGWGYVVIAITCSLSISTVALALARFRDLPKAGDDTGMTSPR
jgi:ABC-type antimicrobial peptide transport system permease subunit